MTPTPFDMLPFYIGIYDIVCDQGAKIEIGEHRATYNYVSDGSTSSGLSTTK